MKFISDVRASARTLMKSKTIGEFLDNLSWGMIDIPAFLTVVFLFWSPLNQFISGIVYYYNDYAELIRTAHHLALIFGSLTIILFVAKNIREKQSFKALMGSNQAMIFFLPLMIIAVVSTALNGFDYYALHGIGDYNETIFTFIMYIGIYYFCASLIGGTKLKKILEYGFIVTSIIIGCAALYSKYISHIDQFDHDIEGVDTIRTVFYHFNHYAYFLAMSILLSAALFVLEEKKLPKALSLTGFLLNTVVLILNDTFGSYLAALLGLIFAVIVISVCRRKLSVSGIIMLGAFIAITVVLSTFAVDTFENFASIPKDVEKIVENTEDSWMAGMGRWHLWRTIIPFIMEKPLLGYGFEGCSVEFLKVGWDLRCHNEFLQYTAFFGIPAGILYLCGVMSVFLRGLKNKYTMDASTMAALISGFGYCVCACTGNSKFYTAPLFFVMMGLATSGKKHK